MERKNFKIVVEYDGSGYHGWQRQKNLPSVQEAIENAVSVISGQKVTVHGSGRTDAGVHALGQVASFHCDTRLSGAELQRGLNSLLPGDIVVLAGNRADDAFHARYDALRKTYRYRILNRGLRAAVGRQYAWHLSAPLNLDLMKEACALLVGKHDFKAFEGTGSPRSHTIREVFRASLDNEGEQTVVFEIEADGFLKFMVRNIVGTLVTVGTGRLGPADFERILLARDRRLAGATAPPHGLFLTKVTYRGD
jgi:tRNA pseudouridine38-40 synthase